jgi:molybdopterin-containing oxidoreductase family membrane subunit
MTASVKQFSSKSGQTALLVVTGLLTALGIAAWVMQLNRGMGATDLSNLNVWGIYIAGFIFFMGLSAGSLVLSALPVLLDLPKFRQLGKIMATVAFASLIVGGLFIMVDIGKPERLWRLVSFGHLNSPMLWDVLLTVVYLVVSTVYLRQLVVAKPGSALKTMAWVALLAGLADGITAFVFSTQVAHELWFSAVQPISFILGAVASACAMALLLVAILKPSGYVKIEYAELAPLVVLTVVLVGLSLVLIGSEIANLAFTRSDSALNLVQAMLTSRLFWVEIICGLGSIIILAMPALRKQQAGLLAGSVLGLVHLAAKRMSFVNMGFAVPNINYPGVNIAGSGTYIPNLLEWGLVAGLIGLLVLLLTVGLGTFGLGASEEK